MSFSCGSDSDCVALDVVAGKLVASIILSGDPGNGLECRSNGLFSPGGTSSVVLPPSPSDGEVAYFLADETYGIEWAFKYRAGASSLYKWEFIGGSYLSAYVNETDPWANAASPGFSASYIDIPGGAVGPTLTVPLEGDYEIVHEAMIDGGTTGGHNVSASIERSDLGSGSASFDDAIANYDTRFESLARHLEPNDGTSLVGFACPAGVTFVQKYAKADTASGTCQFGHRRMMIRPVRALG